ncbi:MAG TPA: DUF6602 domain-containing protein [Terriglobales bacterium]|nr:DUF6602 domain-containing protein [Terriglobales bacterium]
MAREYGKVNLGGLFHSLQRQMETRFETARGSITHDPTKGAAAEQNWLAMLNAYLPERYRAESAFVVDHRGELSEQIDIVIFDRQYSPLMFHQDKVLYVPAESVYAVFDSKFQMTSESIAQAGKKAESVRRLKRTSVPVRFVQGTYKAKELFPIAAGILALETWWTDGMGEGLVKALNGLTAAEMLDLGCTVRSGAFEAATRKRGVEVEASAKENGLIFFFVRLLSRLQKVGTVPAMDLRKYACEFETRWLGKKERRGKK